MPSAEKYNSNEPVNALVKSEEIVEAEERLPID